MSAAQWRTLSATECITEGAFGEDEKNVLTGVIGAGALLANVLATSVTEARGIFTAAGIDLGTTTTEIPDSLRADIIAIARWRWLISLPKFEQFQTDPRKEAYETGIKHLEAVSKLERAVEMAVVPDEGETCTPAGNWGSATYLKMRTDPF